MAKDAGREKSSRIRSVERAIDLLQALNRRPLSTINDLHRETGLPKPSIVRLLRTLEAKGLVAQSSSYGTYQLLGRVKTLSSGFHHEPQIIEVAEEIMIDFTKREGWPLALALFDLNAMVVRASSIPYTSLSLFHSSLNMRLSMVSRALGRAYLAHSTPNEQKIILEIVKHSGDPEDEPARNEEAMGRMIAQVRARGYATRSSMIEPKSSTIAVPVRENGRVVACLGFTWITAAMPLQKAVDQYLPHILSTSEAITAELEHRSPQLREPCHFPFIEAEADLSSVA
ncbi:DNA-binding transcriptional regulator [Caulobacter sp.]|uniref:DNA-binding transcriptional regulator n=1 Tax=Caulobacter sp. TaxID=78 RepID=UPI002B46013C|nr:DNA-binding transcriptional regulator [Caulobacter sp.]HJV40891.1 DNA-binding transcriptional regulator [Caulobacter sp.]